MSCVVCRIIFYRQVINLSICRWLVVSTEFEMAVVETVCVQRINNIRYPVVDISEITVRGVEEKLFVLVGKDLNQSTLPWALHNLEDRQICVLHVHQPAQKIPFSNLFFLQYMFL